MLQCLSWTQEGFLQCQLRSSCQNYQQGSYNHPVQSLEGFSECVRGALSSHFFSLGVWAFSPELSLVDVMPSIVHLEVIRVGGKSSLPFDEGVDEVGEYCTKLLESQ